MMYFGPVIKWFTGIDKTTLTKVTIAVLVS